MESTQTPLPVGQTLHNKTYKILEVLGKGNFGITYLVEHTKTEQKLAIKELMIDKVCTRDENHRVSVPEEFHDHFEHYKELYLEYHRKIATIRDPALVHVVETFENHNTTYAVMYYVAGTTLKDYVLKVGQLTEEQAIKEIKKFAHALHEIHNLGLLHRNINPDSIILKSNGQAVMTNWGFSYNRAHKELRSYVTKITHGFSPIEQYTERTERGTYTDIYSLGATLFFCLTSTFPPSAVQTIEKPLPEP